MSRIPGGFDMRHLSADEVKTMAREVGADLVGIASMDRFEGAPAQMDPRHIFPDAKSAIVIGVRMLRGVLRGIEEGTFFISYAAMGYAGINWVRMPMLLWDLCARIEDAGWETVPIPNIDYWSNTDLHTRETDSEVKARPEWSRPVAPGKPAPDVFPSMRLAAFAAGLGEIGWSRMLLTPEFGPRQRLMMVLTDAELEPDPLYDGPPLCDRCMLCVRECAGHALSETESHRFTVAGREIEWSAIDYEKCLEGMGGGRGYRPFNKPVKPVYEYGCAVEGARGCVRACMIHLEKQAKPANRFHHAFRRRPAWKLNGEPRGVSGNDTADDRGSGVDVAVVRHASCSEHWLRLAPDLPCTAPDAMRYVLDRNATPVRQNVFASGRPPGNYELNGDSPSWPIARLCGLNGGGPGLGGTQVMAVTGCPAMPIRLDGDIAGYGYDDAHARYCWLTGIGPADRSASRAEQARSVFERIEGALADVGMGFEHVVRTWFFNDRILDWYDDFNRVRTEFLRERGIFDGLVPASTGVGMPNALGSALVADVVAVRPGDDTVLIETVVSPLQCSAEDYGSSFSRAVELTTPHHRRLFVSGTASIEPGGRTAHAGNVAAQIDRTATVIHAILESRGMDWEHVTRSTAFFRRAVDTPRLGEWCRVHGVPHLHVVGTESFICRDDLLFELEVDACLSAERGDNR